MSEQIQDPGDPTPVTFGGLTYTDPNSGAYVQAMDASGNEIGSGSITAGANQTWPAQGTQIDNVQRLKIIQNTQGQVEYGEVTEYTAPSGSLITGLVFQSDGSSSITLTPSYQSPN